MLAYTVDKNTETDFKHLRCLCCKSIDKFYVDITEDFTGRDDTLRCSVCDESEFEHLYFVNEAFFYKSRFRK